MIPKYIYDKINFIANKFALILGIIEILKNESFSLMPPPPLHSTVSVYIVN